MAICKQADMFGSHCMQNSINFSQLIYLADSSHMLRQFKNLGVWFDSDFSFFCHVMNTCEACCLK